MTQDVLGGQVRTILAFLGGLAAGQGWIDNETAVTIAGALATLIAAGWSWWAKRNKETV